MIPHAFRPLCRAGATLFAVGALTFGSLAGAQTYPSHTIRILVPTSSGTPPDIISRIIATELSATEGWTVIVENRPGAIGTMAGAEVLRQPADGHEIYVVSVPISAAPALLPGMPFRLDADFAPVIKVSASYNVLVVNLAVPAMSVTELVTLLKSQPDKLNFSSGGFGTPAHLIGEMFKLHTGARALHVPYQQFPQAIADLLNGTNQYMFITMLPVIDLIATGKLRALAVTGPKRVPPLDDVPTIVEQGFPELVVEDWIGFAVKAGTRTEVIGTLNQAVNRALTKPKVREALAKLGAEPAGGTPSEFGHLVTTQIAHWGRVIKQSGIKLQE